MAMRWCVVADVLVKVSDVGAHAYHSDDVQRDATPTRDNTFILLVYNILALHSGVHILLLFLSSVDGCIPLFLQCTVQSLSSSKVV